MAIRAIGVFGLSGVGKTTLIKQFLSMNAGYLHLLASTLIKQGLADPDAHIDSLRLRDAGGIDENQQALVREFSKERSNQPDMSILFDGHLIIDTDKELIDIPYEVISSLNLTKILAVTASGEDILNHRKKDAKRNRPQRTLDEINKQQERSTRLCIDYADRLGVAFFHINAADINGFTAAITE